MTASGVFGETASLSAGRNPLLIAGLRRRFILMCGRSSTDISDGRWEIYLAQRAVDEPLQEFKPEDVLQLDTEAPVEQLVGACERLLRSRLA